MNTLGMSLREFAQLVKQANETDRARRQDIRISEPETTICRLVREVELQMVAREENERLLTEISAILRGESHGQSGTQTRTKLPNIASEAEAIHAYGDFDWKLGFMHEDQTDFAWWTLVRDRFMNVKVPGSVGLCGQVATAVMDRVKLPMHQTAIIDRLMAQLARYRPEGTPDISWWPRTVNGDIRRMEVLSELIKAAK